MLRTGEVERTGFWGAAQRLSWCGVYTRQSRSPRDEFSSCQAQFDACLAFIHSQRAEGWIFNGRQYDDVYQSSEILHRPGFQRLLADIREAKVNRVVVYRFDRLSRRIVDVLSFFEEMRERGVSLTIITQPELGHSAQDTFILNLLASFAEFEQAMTRERLAESPRTR